jgi:predicted lipase
MLCLISNLLAFYKYKHKLKAIENTIENKIFCNETFCPDKIYNIDKVPIQQSNSYQEDIARYVSNLISIVSNNKINDQNPKGLDNIKLLFNDKNNIPFGVIWKDKINNVLFIIFRGTNNIGEWIQDLNVKQDRYFIPQKNNTQHNSQVLFSINENTNVSVHAGFMDAYSKFRENMLDTIKKEGPSQIIVGGHSLGAAISTICGVELFGKGFNTIIYNFASPRVAGENFKKIIDNSKIPIYRIVNEEDIVPTLPPSIVPNLKEIKKPFFYTHCGEQKSFSINRFSFINNHIMSCYKEYLFNNDLKKGIDNKK